MQDEEIEKLIDESAKNLFSNAPCGYLFTRPDGEIIKVNKTLKKWLGFSKEELVGKKKFSDLITKGGKIFYETHYAPLLRMQGFVNEINFSFLRKDGSTFPGLVNATQQKDDQGAPIFNSVIVIDFSDRKKYEKELMIAKKRAEASDEAKTLFLSTISHEILTPLNSIIGSSDLLINTPLTEEQLKLINLLSFSANNLLGLINDILVISKAEIGQYKLDSQSFSIVEVCQNLILSLQYQVQNKPIHLDLTLDPALPKFLIGDPIKISQVLSNLLNNAIKFTKEGRIHLKVDLSAIDNGMADLHFSVSDTGIGIEEERITKIFEPFTQAHKSIHRHYGGSGLGLSICRSILEKYKSKIKVQSQANAGSTFSFPLRLKINKKRNVPNQLSRQLPPFHSIKILLAEDTSTNVFLIVKYFNLWNLKFDTATNGKEAVEKVINNDYDLILMDLEMPVMDGYEATRRIRNLEDTMKKTVPIIAFSASANTEISQKMIDYKIDGFVLKPFQPEVLHQTILKYKRKQNRHTIPLPIPLEKTPISNPDLTNDRQQAVDFSRFYEIFQNDSSSLKQFLHILVKDLQNSKKAIIIALEQKDQFHFQQTSHKLYSILHLLKAHQLKDLLDDCNKRLPTISDKDLAIVKNSIIEEIDRFLTGIDSLLNSE
ncbi:MAG: hypothetical protein DHS20C18_35840 [Saprospiraceae bacterium]|nr:MAG: hypothetical protein DHS20C18_35840 [Saprospiraceae bacterium]